MSYLVINKTPISVLQEWLNHLGMVPRYELLQGGIIHGHCHSFCFRVSVGEIAALGIGRSKKEAKHSAARALLNMLIQGPIAKRQINYNELAHPAPMEDTSALKSDNFHNPVGKLQELCTAKSWAHPHYMLVSEQGPPHDRLFAISVDVQSMKQTGTGRSKRLAKREAAMKMLNQLLNHVNETDSDEYDEDSLCGYNNGYAELLEEVAKEQNIHVHYLDIEDKTSGGLFQCIVRVTTWPIIVCRGQGMTRTAAINNAAMHALECLSLMIKRRNCIKFRSF